jgi:hypothetical protein
VFALMVLLSVAVAKSGAAAPAAMAIVAHSKVPTIVDRVGLDSGLLKLRRVVQS